jgi:hypothetical protein
MARTPSPTVLIRKDAIPYRKNQLSMKKLAFSNSSKVETSSPTEKKLPRLKSIVRDRSRSHISTFASAKTPSSYRSADVEDAIPYILFGGRHPLHFASRGRVPTGVRTSRTHPLHFASRGRHPIHFAREDAVPTEKSIEYDKSLTISNYSTSRTPSPTFCFARTPSPTFCFAGHHPYIFLYCSYSNQIV